MNIETKFNIDDYVYVIKDNTIDKGVIEKIEIRIAVSYHYESYCINNKWYSKDNVYKTPNDLLEQLKQELMNE